MPEILVPDYDGLTIDSLDPRVPRQINRSGWTGHAQVVGLSGAETWNWSVTIDPLATAQEEYPWLAFVLGVGDMHNWFKLRVACQRHIGPMPIVGAGATDGYSLPLVGMQPSTRILSAGQWLTVPLPSGHARLVNLRADLVTDSAGAATAACNFALNEAPTAGVTVESAKPYCPVRSTSPGLGLSWSSGVGGKSFDVEEAL